ncbi:lipid II flippase Amj family protein [Bacillus sp. KH172YL63]|uniref:lipid II flippase Amj family protein n=1 Tax=Bacillus sp. KH172YL63 TaxID=2709784 RepID=UPI0013E51B20|nr:lipid II flippase Amj family protein [Bacillus sp. KH172YL63]BCB05122.1 hypothetical protein KH172YL63_32550 [Bacillus sp. KH172YL63]
MDYLSLPVLSIALFILIIHSIETLAYAVRLSGARVKLIASGLSLFNMMVIVSRMANMMQQPFTGGLTDNAPKGHKLEVVEEQFRVLIGASTLGTILGIVLLPTFVALFSRGIIYLSEQGGSVPRLIKFGFQHHLYKRGIHHISRPGRRYLQGISFRSIPKRLFFINMVITAVYTIGVLAALYAALLVPDRQASATMASGLINGIATILLTLFIDPKISVLADDVANGKGNYQELKGLSIMMVISRLCGTVLAQVIFIPGAYYIAWMSRFFT